MYLELVERRDIDLIQLAGDGEAGQADQFHHPGLPPLQMAVDGEESIQIVDCVEGCRRRQSQPTKCLNQKCVCRYHIKTPVVLLITIQLLLLDQELKGNNEKW